MATTIAFKVEVDGGASVKELTEIEKQLEGINEKVESGNLGFRDSRKLIKEYQDIAVQAGRESPVGQEAIKRAAALTDELGDLRNEITRLSADGQAMQGALALGETVVAGYGAFQGVIALVGNENEKLLETIAKLQAAQSILSGIERIRLSLEKESVLVLQAKVLWTKAVTLAQNGLTKVLGLSTVAARAFSSALAATGIGAIVAAVGLLVANFDKLTDAIGLTTKAQQKADEAFLANSDKRRSAIQQQIALETQRLDLAIREAKLRGVAEEEIQAMLEDRSDLQKKAISEEMREIDLLIAQQTKAYEEAQKANDISGAVKIIEKIKELTGEYEQLNLKLQEVDISQREMSRKGFDDALALEKKLTADKEKEWAVRNEKIKAARAQEEADRLAAEQKAFDDNQNLMNATRDLIIANIQDTAIRRSAQLQAQQSDEREQLIAQYGADTELLKELETKQYNEVQLLKEELRLQTAEAAEAKRIEDLELAEEAFALELEDLNLKGMARAEVEKQNLDTLLADKLISEEEYERRISELNRKSLQEQQQITQGKIQLAQMLASNLSSMTAAIANLAKQGSAEQKALIGIQIAVDTASGIASAVSSGMQLGWPLALIAIPAGIAAVLSGISSAKKAFSKAGGSVPGGGVSMPSFSSMNSSNSSSVASPAVPANTGGIGTSTANAIEQTQMQVVVLASDVSNVNNQNTQIELASVF